MRHALIHIVYVSDTDSVATYALATESRQLIRVGISYGLTAILDLSKDIHNALTVI